MSSGLVKLDVLDTSTEFAGKSFIVGELPTNAAIQNRSFSVPEIKWNDYILNYILHLTFMAVQVT